jgi:hypothetical protein
MARFTTNPVEIQHLQDINQQLTTVASQNGGRVKVVLVNGLVIAGCFNGITNDGSIGGRGGVRMYYGDATIVDDKSNPKIIDKLDIIRVETRHHQS